ncbi:MAG TPA: AMP-binding protein [Gemmatimonadaceae bacterium]|nr:AMP-binding protein [Gemmatimonadaceae bacterium]
MPDPFSLLPLAIAAHGGRIDEFDAQQLVAAGVTLLQRSAPLVRALTAKRSAILLPTTPAFFVALAASEGRGAVLINPLASRHEAAHCVDDANVGAVFTNAALAPLLPPNLPRVLLDDAPRSATFSSPDVQRTIDLGSHQGLAIEGDTDVAGSDDEAAIVYTSAMRGTPLGAILSHRSLLSNARATIVAGELTDADVALALLPFSHLFGLTVSANAPLLAGARVITMPRFNPGRAAERIAAGEITAVIGVPAVFRALLAALERLGRGAGALRLAICGGSPLSTSLQERWSNATEVELRQGYGLTEAGPVCLFNAVDRPNARGTLGRPFPGVDVRIDDGEICVRGDNLFSGYVSHGDAGLFVQDGWLHTGDRGRMNADGTVTFEGVIKPMFTRNGFNIYPAEIERAVRELAGVDAAIATATPTDEDREPEITLEVRGSVTEMAVRQWCSERLSLYRQPTFVRVL